MEMISVPRIHIILILYKNNTNSDWLHQNMNVPHAVYTVISIK